jgi:hypothetical protein
LVSRRRTSILAPSREATWKTTYRFIVSGSDSAYGRGKLSVGRALVGGSPEDQPERYRDASPIERLPFGVPQEFFAGRMFAEQAAPYETVAKRAGDAVHATVLADAGHFVFVDPQSEVWPQVIDSVRRLLSLSK